MHFAQKIYAYQIMCRICSKELVQRIRRVQLQQLVSHRQLILPQLAAPGVNSLAVRRSTGFSVTFGPIRAEDIPAYLDGGHISEHVRTVTFTLGERLVLIPVEIILQARSLTAVLVVGFVLASLSGNQELTGATAFWMNVVERFPPFAAFTFGGMCAGTVMVPLLLPWIPGRMFGVKGALAGLATGMSLYFALGMAGRGAFGNVLWCAALASFLATNFTGSTPFTSPSGVEKELRRWLPIQTLGALTGLLLWVVM